MSIFERGHNFDFSIDVFVCLVGSLTSSSTTRLYSGRAPRQCLTILRAATHDTEVGDHDFQRHESAGSDYQCPRLFVCGTHSRPSQAEKRKREGEKERV